MPDRIEHLYQKAKALPLLPGVYLMKDKAGKIIYVGKAKALKNRVSQYFTRVSSHEEKVKRMVEHVDTFEYIVCDSEFEALILECSLIKQYMPKYNILLKDDKGYHYILVTQGKWPKILAALQMENEGEYLGPYASSYSVSQTVDEVQRVFRLPSCPHPFPDNLKKRRPCLQFHLGRCVAPCAGKISNEAYRELAEGALAYLKTGATKSLERMEKEMRAAAEAMDFEKAACLRDRIAAIRKMGQKQKVVASAVKEQDVIALARAGGRACFEVFRFRQGRLCDQEHFIMDMFEDLPAARSEFLMGYYSGRDRVPPRVTVCGPLEDRALITQYLSEKAGRRVTLSVPQKGDQKKLVDMCRTNAAQWLTEKGRTGKETAALDELARLTGLKEPPSYLEAYDISHTQGSDTVAGMVVFSGGKPLKSAYRKFGLEHMEHPDDYTAMAEVLDRRLKEYEVHKEEGEGFGRLPDMILLDGGLGQVNAVLPVLARHGVAVPLFGMVKDAKHKTRALVSPKGEIAIKATRGVFTLLTQIQDEVHRFSIGFHRQRRKKKALHSALLEIPGIGETRAKALLQHFGSVREVAQATEEELCLARGMSKAAAKQVYAYFHLNEEKDGNVKDL